MELEIFIFSRGRYTHKIQHQPMSNVQSSAALYLECRRQYVNPNRLDPTTMNICVSNM